MEYNELFSKYHQLVRELYAKKTELSTLADGYVSTKKINGCSYYYLQKRQGKKMHRSYIKADTLKQIQKELALRNDLQNEIDSLSKEASKLEEAALVLSPSLHRQMLQLKRGLKMDSVSIIVREQSLLFSSSMLSLEGVQPTTEANNGLQAWKTGKASFGEGYQSVLVKYNLAGRNHL